MQRQRHAVVLVLGDVGRSPRMQYHALSLAEENPTIQVSLVGYRGEQCIPAVKNNPRIQLCYVDPFASEALRKASFLIFAAIKVIALILQLIKLLLFELKTPPAFILVQNPPSIPTLFVGWLVARLRGSMFVIDWHNLGFSILAHAPGRTTRHPLVRIARYYEHLFGRMADKHLCVTNGMRKWLNDNFGVQARVLHDRPPSFFGPTSLAGQHELFMRIGRQLRDWKVEEKYTAATGIVVGEGETLFTTFIGSAQKFTRVNNAGSRLKTDIVLRDISRPALLVSSTSWTEDEDFSVLLAALRDLDAKWAVNPSPSTGTRGSNASKPFVVVVVTGKGPLKAHYEALIRASPLQRIAICTMWLEAEDYPKLIGSADLGVSLHTSTSGVDLPMKVLDMFGCQVPVCAMGFPCLSELVRDNVNGFVFQTATELAVCLDTLLGRFPMDTSKLDQLRAGVKGMERWEGHWRRHAALYLAIKDVTKSWCVFGAWFGLLLAFVFAAIVARPG